MCLVLGSIATIRLALCGDDACRSSATYSVPSDPSARLPDCTGTLIRSTICQSVTSITHICGADVPNLDETTYALRRSGDSASQPARLSTATALGGAPLLRSSIRI